MGRAAPPKKPVRRQQRGDAELGMIHIVACEACVLLDLQGIEVGTDGNDYLLHSLATLLRNELTDRGLLDDPLATVMRVPTCHIRSRNVTQY